jgi:hypothetical protein
MRYELTDDEWTAIKPMLPNKPRGVPRVNDRRVLNGAFDMWMARTSPHIPFERYADELGALALPTALGVTFSLTLLGRADEVRLTRAPTAFDNTALA